MPFHDIAVPCFFMITGYFLYSEDVAKTVKKAFQNAKKVLGILLFFTCVYFIVDPFDVTSLPLPVIVRWVFVGIPNNPGGPLWYLVALFWGLLVFGAVVRITQGRRLLWMIALVSIGLAIGRYRFLLDGQESSYFVFNFVNYALPCLTLGYYARKWERRIVASKRLLDYTILISLIFCVERALVSLWSQGGGNIGPLVFTFLVAFSWIALALQHKGFGAGSFAEQIGRDYSADIYYWHMLFVVLFRCISTQTEDAILYEYFGSMYVFGIALCFAIALRKGRRFVSNQLSIIKQ